MRGAVLTAAFVLVSASAGAGAPMRWEEAFSSRVAPKQIHFRGSYADAGGATHTIEVWRDRDTRLRRDTDGKMSVHVTRGPSNEYAYEVVDRVRSVKVRVSRTNLYRIGVFSDWSSLATNLTRPAGPHTVIPSARGATRTNVGECRWVRVEAARSPAREICWSSALALPLLIERDEGSGKYARELAIDDVSTSIADVAVFTPPAEGFFEVDANRDIAPGDD